MAGITLFLVFENSRLRRELTHNTNEPSSYSLYIVPSTNILLTPECTMLLLVIGENWNGFMYSLNLKNSAPDCDPNPESHPENFNWYEIQDERVI